MSDMFEMNEFQPHIPRNDPVPTTSEIPEELEIFYRDEREFLPEGKDFDDLTEAEKKKLRNQYRFDPLKPGIYQGITGFGNMPI